jgi:hypothetical protein
MSRGSAIAAIRRRSEMPPAWATSGWNHAHGATRDQFLELPACVEPLARRERDSGARREIAQRLDVVPDNWLLEKQWPVRRQRFRELPADGRRAPTDASRPPRRCRHRVAYAGRRTAPAAASIALGDSSGRMASVMAHLKA